MKLNDIIGQSQVINHLRIERNSGRIPHAHLFVAPEGRGALPLALAYAQYLSCAHPTADGDSCGTCPSCRKFARLEHPDLHLIFPIIKPDSRKDYTSDDFLSTLRPLLISNPYLTLPSWISQLDATKQGLIYASESDHISRILNLKAYEAPYKIVIIWGVDKMNEICANKLLKILEEPTPDTLFLLTTDNTEALLPTILSRVQTVALPPIDQSSLCAALKAKYPTASDVDLTRASRMSLGSYPSACALLEQDDEDQVNFQTFVSLMRYAYSGNYLELKKWSESFDKNRERTKQFLAYAQRMVRENFIYNFHLPITYLTPDEEAFSRNFSRFINTRNVELIVDDLQKAAAEIEQNCAIKIVLFSFALHLSTYLRK